VRCAVLKFVDSFSFRGFLALIRRRPSGRAGTSGAADEINQPRLPYWSPKRLSARACTGCCGLPAFQGGRLPDQKLARFKSLSVEV